MQTSRQSSDSFSLYSVQQYEHDLLISFRDLACR